MKKIVINAEHGGFTLSDEAAKALGVNPFADVARDDPKLIELVEQGNASGYYASLKVVEIPNDVDWVIEAYDGREWISEKHMKWE